MTIPLHEQFPNGSIICLESSEQETASYLLSEDIRLAMETEDPELIAELRQLWDDEPWEQVVERSQVEGSTWYVWWMDGVNAFARRASSSAQATNPADR